MQTVWLQRVKNDKKVKLSAEFTKVFINLIKKLELKEYDNERLRRLGALISESDYKTQKWSEIETANLLRGILKHGEQNWKSILNEEQFEKSRTVNQLILKWRMIKIIMKGELDAMNVKRQKLITKNDWVVAAIKGLEKKNNIHRDLPAELYHLYPSALFRNGDKYSDDMWNSIDSSGGKGARQAYSNNKTDNTPLLFEMKKNKGNITLKQSNFLLENKIYDDFEIEMDSEGSEEPECPDFFVNINWNKKQSAAQIPPQNYIIPKDRSILKNKLGNRSFMKRIKSKPDEKDTYKIELI